MAKASRSGAGFMVHQISPDLALCNGPLRLSSPTAAVVRGERGSRRVDRGFSGRATGPGALAARRGGVALSLGVESVSWRGGDRRPDAGRGRLAGRRLRPAAVVPGAGLVPRWTT